MRVLVTETQLPFRRLILGLGLFSAVTALAGGIEMLLWPRGNELVPITLLATTPFRTFLVPGLLLGGVVGGTSLVSAVLAWRRSRAAVDATILAGGSLTVWIAAEVAMFREVYWLHVLCGAIGLAMLGLGVLAGWRSRLPRHRWVIAVTAAEAVGYLAPALTGILSSKADLGDAARAGALVMAGLFEGFACGAGQAWAFPLPLRRFRYAVLTALGAGVVWAMVMAMMSLGERGTGVPLPVFVLAIAIAAVIGLGVIGGAQWLELRHHAKRAHRWIAWTALAWAVALPLSFTPGPFVDETTPMASHVALWGCAGVLMAYVMALITWQGVRRLTQGEEPHAAWRTTLTIPSGEPTARAAHAC